MMKLLKKIYTDRDEVETAISLGMEEGMKKGLAEGETIGMEKGKMQMVNAMLESGLSPEEVARITGLTLEQVNKKN